MLQVMINLDLLSSTFFILGIPVPFCFRPDTLLGCFGSSSIVVRGRVGGDDRCGATSVCKSLLGRWRSVTGLWPHRTVLVCVFTKWIDRPMPSLPSPTGTLASICSCVFSFFGHLSQLLFSDTGI